MMKIVCSNCNQPAKPLDWICEKCGGMLEFDAYPVFHAGNIQHEVSTLWRYADWLPVQCCVSLGEGLTPLSEMEMNNRAVLVKQEYLNPTGSYKDRGTVVMMNHIAAHDVSNVVEDSSGNAGASVAAYSSALGIHPRIFVPASGGQAKKNLIEALGGDLEPIAGAQAARTQAARKAAKTTTYASHAYSPYFVLGQMTVAFEVWEQTAGNVPDVIATPLGHGGLFLGFYRGFQVLLAAGLIDRVPKMVAVQSAGCDPIVRAFEAKAHAPPEITAQETIADGIRVDHPVRGKAVLAAIYDTDGVAIRVDDTQIETARNDLWRKGFICEPTSAVTGAALSQIFERFGDDTRVLIALTGNGLKNIAG